MSSEGFRGATNPVTDGGFPTTCEQCHDTVQWTDGNFDHSTTGFTLTGCIPCRRASALIATQQQLQPDEHDLRLVPHEGFSGHDQSEPRDRKFSQTCDLPYDERLVAGDASITRR